MRKAVKAEGVTTNTNAVRRIGFSLQYDCLSAIIAPTKHHHFVTPHRTARCKAVCVELHAGGCTQHARIYNFILQPVTNYNVRAMPAPTTP